MKRPTETANEDTGLLSQRVTNAIRDLILSGQLAPGSRIRQEALAERFGTSRLPIRHALPRLESEGLIILKPNSGGWVAKLDLQECLETYKIRERIEPLALAESTANIDDDQIQKLQRLAHEMEHTKDGAEFLRLDREFHLASYQASEMPHLISLCERFWNSTQHYRRAYIGLVWPEDNWIIFYEHRLMLEAMKRHDGEEAGQLLQSHIRRTRLELERNKAMFQTPEVRTRRGRPPKAHTVIHGRHTDVAKR